MATARAVGPHLGQVALRHGQIETQWWLPPHVDPATLRDVHLLAGGVDHPVEVVPVSDANEAHGVLRSALPAADLPWGYRGEGPAGPWRREVSLDPTVLDDYRRATPLGAHDERDGVRLTVERVLADSARVAVFYSATAEEGPASARLASLCTGDTRVHRVSPPTATWPPLPTIQADVAYFPPLPAGTAADFSVERVTVALPMEASIQLPLPPALPAVTAPDIPLCTGHRLVEAVYSLQGLTLRLDGPPEAGDHGHLEVTTDDGRRLVTFGGWSGGGAAGLMTRPWPAGCPHLILTVRRQEAPRFGPWHVPLKL